MLDKLKLAMNSSTKDLQTKFDDLYKLKSVADRTIQQKEQEIREIITSKAASEI